MLQTPGKTSDCSGTNVTEPLLSVWCFSSGSFAVRVLAEQLFKDKKSNKEQNKMIKFITISVRVYVCRERSKHTELFSTTFYSQNNNITSSLRRLLLTEGCRILSP